MRKLLAWFDEYLLFWISLFLLIFIPLYPKWPLFEVLPGYIVRVRLEDFLVLAAFLIWLIFVLRGNIKPLKNPLFLPIIAYLVVGFLSTISAIFITKTVTGDFIQVAKLYLHYIRRIEYFSLFFIFYSGVRKIQQSKILLFALPGVIFAITIYGYGQKYLYWPAYSTMNREFSKGISLYLTAHARVLSTFGGHYDLAAYIMLTLPILISMTFVLKNKILRLLLVLVSLVEFWLLILTASRTSFIAYLSAITMIFLILSLKKGIKWSLVRWAAVTALSLFIMLAFGDLSERFAHILRFKELKAALTSPFRAPPTEGIPLDESLPLEEQLKRVAAKSDVPPTPEKPLPEKPADVYSKPYLQETTTSAEIAKQTTASAIHVDYSKKALKYGLSAGIRLDALWPKAWQGFMRNPLLGTGYSTLVKSKVWEFTQAESTDNDYLRLLGETGILGFFTFLGIFFVILKKLFNSFKKSKDEFLTIGFAVGIGITFGFLVNALYIDVFESSKVAYTYWSLMGILLAQVNLLSKHKKIKDN